MADSNIRLRDAAGREIPVGTNIVYTEDGKKLYIREVTFNWFINKCELHLVEIDGGIFHKRVLYPEHVYLKNPITQKGWEKLLDDLDNAAKGGDNAECCYMRREDIEVCEQCSGCRLYEQGKGKFNECSYLAYADIAARIRKLAAKED